MLNRCLKSSFLFTCLIGFLFSAYSQTSSDGKNESRLAKLKAAYIYKFTDKVYWPHEDQLTVFKICVMSSPALAEQLGALEQVAKFRKRIPIKVTLCNSPDEIKNCQMVVADGSGTSNLWAIYSKIRGKGALMVAENLVDFKKSMISFTIVDGKLKYIINKTKMDESNLVVKDELYTFAITREGDWNSIFDKFNHMLQADEKDVKVDKADIAQFMSEYNTLANETRSKEEVIAQMEDSLQAKAMALRSRMEEYKRLNENIEAQKNILAQQTLQMEGQKKLIGDRDVEIGKQKTVIAIIAILSCLILIVLLLAVRVNGQRRKANRLLSLQKTEIERQKLLVEEKQKEILDSITYAKRIQTALMASESTFQNHLTEHFIVFKPKDIVAGDFFWATPVNDGFVYITADSTGHGVPGAFMSLLNISKLNEAVKQKNISRPDLVLNEVKKEIIAALNPEGSTEESKDGMDAVLCKIDLRNLKLQYAAANNSFFIVRDGQVLTCSADKSPVGKSHNDNAQFTFNEVALFKGDMIYTFTDGYTDQFGGPRGKKFKIKQLKEMIAQSASLPVAKQKIIFKEQFDNWKGPLEQVDDVLLIGVRV